VIKGDLVTSAQLQAKFPRNWHLYDIVADRGETTDQSQAEPDTLRRLQSLYQAYRARVGVVDP